MKFFCYQIVNLANSCILVEYNLQDVVVFTRVLHLVLPALVLHHRGVEGHLCAGDGALLHGRVDVLVDHVQLEIIITGCGVLGKVPGKQLCCQYKRCQER